jgi:hypothetical protein
MVSPEDVARRPMKAEKSMTVTGIPSLWFLRCFVERAEGHVAPLACRLRIVCAQNAGTRVARR